jgi:hypothetical protein
MNEQLFNPFEDRLSRDIRNDLSEGLAGAIETGSSEKLKQTVEQYRKQPLAQCYKEYLEARYGSYKKALEIINKGIKDPIQQGLVLWDLELFFEVHEVLEHTWYSAEGNMKKTLQALIRAAGVYIKREYGFNDSAIRIAAKAIPVFEENRALLEPYFELERLIGGLNNPEAPPPKLL